MSGAVISSVSPTSPAAAVGLLVGDTITSINDVPPTDVIEYQRLTDGDNVVLLVQRGEEQLLRRFTIIKDAGQPLGITVESAVFDRKRTPSRLLSSMVLEMSAPVIRPATLMLPPK